MRPLFVLFAVAAVAVGCSSSDPGELPPPPKPMTQAELDAMPPQARAAMENAQRQGQQMAQTRGVAGGGR